jgi:dTDP-4-amino-4,6-dideoxygalactose transaminase
LRSHGITRDAAQMTHAPDGPWYYQQIDLGFNYRMTDIQAALGLSQLSRLNDYVAARHAIANRYNQALVKLPLTLPHQHDDTYSSYHLYVVRLELENIRKTHRQVFEELREQGIGVNLHYIPVYRQPYYQAMGFNCEHYPNAEGYYREAISLPMYATLTPKQQENVIAAMTDILCSN